MLQKAFILALLFITTSIQATDYYVDYSGGNDSNNGTTTETAWKTTTKVKNYTLFSASDNVYFKRGEKWQSEIDCDTYTFYIGNQTNKQFAYAHMNQTYSIYVPYDLFLTKGSCQLLLLQ